MKNILRDTDQERTFCEPCGLLLLRNEHISHNDHNLVKNISRKQLKHPTQLMPPLSNAKANAVSRPTLKLIHVNNDKMVQISVTIRTIAIGLGLLMMMINKLY